MKDFKNLSIWQKSHQLALVIYQETKKFPEKETYGLISQMRRCAVSIPANIAEGCCRQGNQEFARFLQIAMGSASELEYYLILTLDLGYITKSSFESLTEKVVEIKKMTSSLITKLRAGN